MKYLSVAGILIALLASCDSAGSDPFTLTGTWRDVSGDAGLGRCCDFELNLIDDNGTVTGSALVKRPGAYVGEYRTWYADVEGTYDPPNVTLTLTSGPQRAEIEGVVVPDEGFSGLMRVSYDGYGGEQDSIGLFLFE